MWRTIVFELHNIRYFPDYAHIYDQASRGEISAKEYVKTIFEHEYRALNDTRAFYAYVFIPHAIEKALTTDPKIWYVAEYYWRWADADDAFASRRSMWEYPWKPYWGDYWRLRYAGFKEERGMPPSE